MPNRLQNTFILKEIMLYCFILMLMFLISSFYFILQQKRKTVIKKILKKIKFWSQPVSSGRASVVPVYVTSDVPLINKTKEKRFYL